jgi:hypothetical protein
MYNYKMVTKVISAFPGTGKSYFASHVGPGVKVVDLDSNKYTSGHAADGKIRDPGFSNNYMLAIKEHIGKTDVLFVSCHPETLAALQKEGIPFTLVYPERGLKAEYADRFKQRRSPQPFISLLASNWDAFLDFLESQNDCEHIVLNSGQYIGDIMPAHAI